MIRETRLGGLDAGKLLLAFLVIAIHTAPLASWSAEADFFLTRILARVAVPFFLMVSGYFLLPQYLFLRPSSRQPLWRFLGKTGLLYLGISLVYLPLAWYAGYFEGLTVLSALRLLVFDGMFYHLWYLPGVAMGVLLVWLLSRKLPPSAVLALCLGLYLLGLLGDSYFGLATQVPGLAAVYDAGFTLFSYTRNGLFFTPLFLVLGAFLARAGERVRTGILLAIAALCLLLMTGEGFLLRAMEWQRHDSMYLMLLPLMCALFLLARRWTPTVPRDTATLAMWIYLLHPGVIVLVRGAAKYLDMQNILVAQSGVHYLAVCIVTLLLSCILLALWKLVKPQPISPTGRAWITLDRKALAHNVAVIRRRLPPDCQMMAAVKANAYGHGDVLVARELNRLGVYHFCVASLAEGVHLRRAGVNGSILILGYTHPEQFPLLRRYALAQTVLDAEYGALLAGYGRRLSVHLAVDTGMHRLGEPCAQAARLLPLLRHPRLRVEGVFSHLCAADVHTAEGEALTATQLAAFQTTVTQLEAAAGRSLPAHIQASYGLVNCANPEGAYARIGIALYGMLSTKADTTACPLDLRPVLSAYARVAAVKHLQPGDYAGYGLAFHAEREMTLAVLAIGYADGFPRALSCGRGGVLLGGKYAPVIGRVCMDQTLVDISDIEDVRVGDAATIIGRSGDARLGACDLAAQTGTISNEVLSRLGARLARQML